MPFDSAARYILHRQSYRDKRTERLERMGACGYPGPLRDRFCSSASWIIRNGRYLVLNFRRVWFPGCCRHQGPSMIYNLTNIYFVHTPGRSQIGLKGETHTVNAIFSALTFPGTIYSNPSLTAFSSPPSNFSEILFNFASLTTLEPFARTRTIRAWHCHLSLVRHTRNRRSKGCRLL